MHATCVAVAETGVLIEGPPGSGKSSLALRLIDQPGFGHGGLQLAARLVADDQVIVVRQGNELRGKAPQSIRGKLEIRGLGVVNVTCLDDVRIGLIVRLASAHTIERMPDPEQARADILGINLPLVLIDPAAASAPARLRAAVIELSGTF